MKVFCLRLIVLLGFTIILQGNVLAADWYHINAEKNVTINVDLFLSSTCPHCHKEDLFFREVEKKEPWLIVHRYVINQDKSALETFFKHLHEAKETNISVPSLFFCDSHWIGFSDEATTGKILLDALKYCRSKIIQQGQLSSETISVLQKESASMRIRMNANVANSALLFTSWAALTDATNPCSLFCMSVLLAFLWLYPLQKWSQFGLGLVFLLSLGATHLLQQIYSTNYHQSVPQLSIWPILVGIVLLFLVFKTYRNQLSGAIANPSLMTVVVMALMVLMVQLYQQTCALNMTFIYNQWLTNRAYPEATRLFYQMLYQVFYLLPYIGLLLFYLLMGRHRWIRPFHKGLNWAAYLILSSIGIILLLFPPLFGNLWASLIVLVGSMLVGWFAERLYAKTK